MTALRHEIGIREKKKKKETALNQGMRGKLIRPSGIKCNDYS